MTESRKYKKFLTEINKKGWVKYNGIIIVAAGAILQVINSQEIDSESYLRNLLRTKILCSDNNELNEIKAQFIKYGFKPTDNKFILLT